MNEKKLTPKRRFKGFEDTWILTELGEVANFFNNLRVPIDTQKRIRGNHPYYGATGVIDYVKDYIFEGEYILLAEDGENILTRNSEVAYITKGKFWVNNHAHVMNMRFGSNLFLLQLLERQDYTKYNSGTAQPKLNGEVVKNMIFCFPDALEQQKIGNFFKHLDQMILLEQRKLEKTKALKSAYLAEMFPAEGERVPKRRFAEFTDEWREYNLQSICSVFKDGDWIESKDQSKDGVRLIQTGNIGLTKFIEKSKSKKWISRETFKKLNCSEVFPGDILISRLPEPAGRACLIPNMKTKIITSVDCTIVRMLDNYSADYLVQYLSTSKYFKEVTNLLGGGTRQRISRGALSLIKISLPNSLEEQQLIGDFFKKLDDQITNQQQKLNKLKAMKQAYLEEMFV